MQGHHHSVIEEFPELRERIHALKVESSHFKGLAAQWEESDKQIARAESRIDLMSPEEEEKLRKTRLALKDEMYRMLTATR